MRLVKENMENMKSKQQDESLDTTDKQSYSSKEELKYETIEGTPFAVAEVKGDWVVLLGNDIVGVHRAKENAMEDAKTITWSRIIAVVLKSQKLLNNE
jgi:hypothetical protein